MYSDWGRGKHMPLSPSSPFPRGDLHYFSSPLQCYCCTNLQRTRRHKTHRLQKRFDSWDHWSTLFHKALGYMSSLPSRQGLVRSVTQMHNVLILREGGEPGICHEASYLNRGRSASKPTMTLSLNPRLGFCTTSHINL